MMIAEIQLRNHFISFNNGKRRGNSPTSLWEFRLHHYPINTCTGQQVKRERRQYAWQVNFPCNLLPFVELMICAGSMMQEYYRPS